jgi:hypothetical protein
MPKDIFAMGLLDWQRRELETIDHAEEMNFHSLLSYEELVEENLGFDELLDRCRRQLRAFDGQPDAIVCHWDFPSSCLAPVLAAEFGVRGPSLQSVLKCEHKYWARVEQQKVVPECVPGFDALDPFDPAAADKLRLDFPIWLKPVKGFSSLLGFRIENRDELEKALAELREHIGELGQPFDECLRHADIPSEVNGIGGRHAIAETIMRGRQFAPEGYVLDGEMQIHGMFDMMLGQDGKSVAGLRYPADLPSELEEQCVEVCRKVLAQVGFDNGCFNVEFLWDEEAQKLWLIEVNTRISQSHCELFRQVNGMSNHEIAVSVALGHAPHLPPPGVGRIAAKFILTKLDDAVVTRAPSKAELEEIGKKFDALIELMVEEGDSLSEVRGQPVYCFNVAEVWVVASSLPELMKMRARIAEKLPLEFSDGRGLAV